MQLLCAVDSARVRATIFVVIAQKYLGHQPWWAINHHIPSKITNICGKTAKRSWGIKRANFPKPFWDIHKIAKAKTTSGNFALSAGAKKNHVGNSFANDRKLALRFTTLDVLMIPNDTGEITDDSTKKKNRPMCISRVS